MKDLISSEIVPSVTMATNSIEWFLSSASSVHYSQSPFNMSKIVAQLLEYNDVLIKNIEAKRLANIDFFCTCQV